MTNTPLEGYILSDSFRIQKIQFHPHEHLAHYAVLLTGRRLPLDMIYASENDAIKDGEQRLLLMAKSIKASEEKLATRTKELQKSKVRIRKEEAREQRKASHHEADG